MKTLPFILSPVLSLEETVSRLSASLSVDGLALFGSRTVASDNPVSDYDLLVLVANPPVRIFQMLTHINGRMADVIFVETDTADRIPGLVTPVSATSWEGMFLLKMLKAQIVYDKSDRLKRTQQYIVKLAQSPDWLEGSTDNDVYSAWFWLNHSLAHVRRMSRSDDPMYLTAADMMLLTGLSNLCRAYFQIRHLAWEGEKAAVRYLQAHDPDFLMLLRACLASTMREDKLASYEKLVARAIAPSGHIWQPGTTAVYLKDSEQQSTQIQDALAFWERLLQGK